MDATNFSKQQTESFLDKAVQEWQNMPPQKLSTSPKAGAWSVAQCLEHLNFYSQYYLPAIETAIEKAEKNGWKATDTFKSGWLGNYFYNLMLPNTEGVLKSKMKAPKNAIPQAQPNPQKMVIEFIDHQEKLLQLIERARKINISRVRVPISISQWIKLKLGDTFLFLIAHQYRHTLQIERILKGKQLEFVV